MTIAQHEERKALADLWATHIAGDNLRYESAMRKLIDAMVNNKRPIISVSVASAVREEKVSMPHNEEGGGYKPRNDPAYLFSVVKFLVEGCEWLFENDGKIRGPAIMKRTTILKGLGEIKNVLEIAYLPDEELLPEKEACKRTPADFLEEIAGIYRERKPIYGDNYKHVGPLLRGLFPGGIHVEASDEESLNRLHLIFHMVSKLTRYSQNLLRGGHQDSLDDLAVYAMLARECDEEKKS